jgi:hypothetical protein
MNPTPETLMETLAALARERIAENIAENETLTVEVKYFGHGSRFHIERGRGGINVRLYIHDARPADFTAILADAIEAVKRMRERKVSIDADLLAKLYYGGADRLTLGERAKILATLGEVNA